MSLAEHEEFMDRQYEHLRKAFVSLDEHDSYEKGFKKFC
jgi:hypothetical protein